MPTLKTINISEALDRELRQVLPKHLQGKRQTRVRFEHVAREWLAQRQKDKSAPALQQTG